MSLKGDILKVSLSNIVALLSSIINGFVLPAMLSIEDYAQLKTYTLYASFIGFLHLGFVDGINIKYGGKRSDEILPEEFSSYHGFFLIFQLLAVVSVIAFGIVIGNTILIFVGLTILPLNLKSFFLFFFQAIGEFSLYTRLAIITPIVNIVITVILVSAGIRQYEYYICSNIIGYILAVIYIEIKTSKVMLVFNLMKIRKAKPSLIALFYSGFFIMLGNTLFVVFFNIGRWLSKIFLADSDFAIYSFGISLIGFITIFINAVTQSFYPHLSRNMTNKIISRYREIFFVIGSFSILGYFFIYIVVDNFIEKYTESLILTGILLTTIPGVLIVKSLYVNIYKVMKLERKFLYDTLRILFLAILASGTLFYIYHNNFSIAIAAVISIYIWIILPPSFIAKSWISRVSELLYISLLVGGFIFILLSDLHPLHQLILTFLMLCILNLVFYKHTMFDIGRQIRKGLGSIFNKITNSD